MNIQSQIESLLFITNQPFSAKKLAEILKVNQAEVEQAIESLIATYNEKERGIHIQKIENKVQMVASPDNAKLVADFTKEEMTGELTRPALETLTIVAYRGPLTRAEIEKIRGVNCAVILRNLQMRGLVESAEDKKKMQQVYSITFDFLKHLGVNQPSELPDYTTLNSDENLEKILKETNGEED